MAELKALQEAQPLNKYSNADLVVTPEGVVVSIQNRSKRGRKSRSAEAQPLRAIRLSRGLTLEELSAVTQMSPSYLSRLESGTRRLNSDTIRKLSSALGCNSNDLLSAQDRWNPEIQGFFQNPSNYKVADGKLTKSQPNPFANERIALYSSDEQTNTIDLNNCSQSIACPPDLSGVPGAYSYVVNNDDMSPKFRRGDIVHIHPGRPLTPGSYAMIITSDAKSIIGEFMSWSDDNANPSVAVRELGDSYSVELKQYNSNNKIKINQNDISSIGRIIGCSEKI